jgi:hypothetical protein
MLSGPMVAMKHSVPSGWRVYSQVTLPSSLRHSMPGLPSLSRTS